MRAEAKLSILSQNESVLSKTAQRAAVRITLLHFVTDSATEGRGVARATFWGAKPITGCDRQERRQATDPSGPAARSCVPVLPRAPRGDQGLHRMRLLREERVAGVRDTSCAPVSRLLQLVSSLLQRPRTGTPPREGRHAIRPPWQASGVAHAATQRDPVETGTVEGSQACGQCARPAEEGLPAATRPAARAHARTN